MSSAPPSVKLTVVYDNYSTRDGLGAAWGFSCLVENFDQVILFDTGGHGPTLMANMSELGIAPDSVDAIVLSHAHWDHTGGLPEFLDANSDVTVYMLSSFPDKTREVARRSGARLVEVSGPADICPGVKTTGEMASGKGAPEQSLIMKSESGVVALTGCAHPGVVSIVERAVGLAGRRILVVAGGYHLHRVSEAAVREVASHLQELGVGYVAPCHCSGDRAVEIMREAFGTHCLGCGAGVVVDTARLA